MPSVLVPKRPPLIVTTLPPAQLPDVGSIDEMNGPFVGTGWYWMDFSAEPHSKVALIFEMPDEVAPRPAERRHSPAVA